MLAPSRVLVSLLLALPATVRAAPTTWYVDAAGTPPGSGTASDPYASIQHAIAQPTTLDGDLVLVAPGTYLENLDFLGKEIVVAGSAGAAQTIVDGGQLGPVARFVSGEGADAVLQDLTLQNGKGENAAPGQWQGGGARVVGSSPTLRRLVVRLNQGTDGRGLYFDGSQSLVEGCLIRQNGPSCYCSTRGGGIWSSGAIRVVRTRIEQHGEGGYGGGVFGAGFYLECLIRGNVAAAGGGAYAAEPGALSFLRCVFEGNTADSEGSATDGGGILGPALAVECILRDNRARQGAGAAGATLVRCSLRGNVARSFTRGLGAGGGAAGCTLIDCEVVDNRSGIVAGGQTYGGAGGGLAGGTALRCRIEGNVALGSGGGAIGADLVECVVEDNVAAGGANDRGGGLCGGSATRSLFTGNSAPRGGGAAIAQLDRCTLVGNVAAQPGGGYASTSGTNRVESSILRGNVPDSIAVYAGTLRVRYSDVEGGHAGIGNFDLDPSFVDPAAGDHHLQAGSPCIDAGDPAAPPDADGSPADVGAYAFVPGWCGPVEHGCPGKVNSQDCVPQAGWQGYPSLSGPDAFVVTAGEVINQQPGFLVWGRAPASVPFLGGTLCVAPPLRRTPAQGSGGTPPPSVDCSGTYAFAFTHAYLASEGVLPGDTVDAQWIARDTLHSDGTGASLSSSMRFTLCP